MSVELDRQLRDYCGRMDQAQVAVSIEEILERSGELQLVPGRQIRHRSQPIRSARTPDHLPRHGLTWAVAAFVVILMSGVLAIAFSGDNQQVVDQTTVPTPTTVATTVPDPTTTLSELIHNWPSTSQNPAGLYSWGGGSCGSFCIAAFMHNGYGSGDVSITIGLLPEMPATPDDATAVTVAGHEAIYQRISDRLEVWIVDIEEVTIAIRLRSEPGTS